MGHDKPTVLESTGTKMATSLTSHDERLMLNLIGRPTVSLSGLTYRLTFGTRPKGRPVLGSTMPRRISAIEFCWSDADLASTDRNVKVRGWAALRLMSWARPAAT